MSAYLARTFHRKADGTKLFYYILRENYWDRQQKRQRQRYLAYIGTKPVLSAGKAQELVALLSARTGKKITLDDLRRIRGLQINEEAPPASDWRAKFRGPWERV